MAINSNNNGEESPYYGWYSESRAMQRGSIIFWSTPDGGRVAVTSVSRSETQKGSFRDDVRLVGPVVNYVCTAPYEPPSLYDAVKAIAVIDRLRSEGATRRNRARPASGNCVGAPPGNIGGS
nr:hypothetical protein [Pandoravirus massiliensis]